MEILIGGNGKDKKRNFKNCREGLDFCKALQNRQPRIRIMSMVKLKLEKFIFGKKSFQLMRSKNYIYLKI